MPDLHGWTDIADGTDFTDLTAYAQHALAVAFAETQAEVDRILLFGNGTGEARSLLDHEPPREPTPIERALAILDPELRRCPLYKAGPPAIYPTDWKATP